MIQTHFNTPEHLSQAPWKMPDFDDGCVLVCTFLLEHPPLTSGHSCRDRAAAWGSLQTHLSLGLHKWLEVQMWKGGWRRSRPSSQSWTFLKTHKRTGTRKGGSHRPRDTKRKSLLWESWPHMPPSADLNGVISASQNSFFADRMENHSWPHTFYFGKCFIKTHTHIQFTMWCWHSQF